MSKTFEIWRLVKQSRVDTAFDGEGAFRYGGRWNHRGQRVVYASSSLALALLEVLVHIDPAGKMPELVAIPIQVPQQFLETVHDKKPDNLKDGFNRTLAETREAGSDWLGASKNPVMQVPSAVIPIEHNYLLNPEHPDFVQLKTGRPEPFSFDPRLRPA